jgi:phage tail sheath protein FI
MSETFLHGVEVLEINDGPRPIRSVQSAIIGLIGTAPNADATAYPFNTPVLINGSQSSIKTLGATGTLPSALEGIFDQAGASVVVVRVEQNGKADETQSKIIGNSTQKTGLWAFTAAMSKLGIQPRILIAPGFSNAAVTTELLAVAQRIRAIVIADGPNTTDAEAITFAAAFGSDRLYIVDPQVQVFRKGTLVNEPASPRVAGLIAKSDNDYGFWRSPSNQEILGIVGTSRPIDFTLADRNTSANLLNEKNIATIIRQNGFRLWGNRSTSADPKYTFLSVRRTADMIFDSILHAHLWAVDRNITKTYLSDVAEGVNQYLRSLLNQGAILGGKCWPDPHLNSAANLADGKVYFNFDFAPPYPAERLTFRAQINNNYLNEILTK